MHLFFMKRSILLSVLLLTCILPLFSQKGTSQFSIVAGYEHFPELKARNGYNIGTEFKHYVHNRFYVVANFHAGINDGSKHVEYTNRDVDYKFDLYNSVRDYMVGFGLGADVMHIKRHKIYLQCTAGLGSSEVSEDYITSIYFTDMVQTNEQKAVRFAVSASAGYEYQLTDWLAIGANYTAWQIGYEMKNSANIKLGITF